MIRNFSKHFFIKFCDDINYFKNKRLMDYPELKNLTKNMYSKQYISKYYPEFYEYLNNTDANYGIRITHRDILR